MKNILEDKQCIQIGFVVRDLEKTKKIVADFLGVEVPPTKDSGVYEITKCEYKGEPAPDTGCNMAFFYLGNLQIEFIEPVGEGPSVWKDFLAEKGEGMHHIAFPSKNIPEATKRLEEYGIPMVQKGEYRQGNGRYAYFAAENVLKTMFELLESY